MNSSSLAASFEGGGRSIFMTIYFSGLRNTAFLNPPFSSVQSIRRTMRQHSGMKLHGTNDLLR
jgi:hypothetical protein